MTNNLPFFGLKFRRGIPGNQEECSHWMHVAQSYRGKKGNSSMKQLQRMAEKSQKVSDRIT